MKQGELFESLKPRGKNISDKRFDETLSEGKFEIRLTIDKIIFVTLIFLILLVVIFTIGVEHGKSIEKESLGKRYKVESMANLAQVRKTEKSLGFQKRVQAKEEKSPSIKIRTNSEKPRKSGGSLLGTYFPKKREEHLTKKQETVSIPKKEEVSLQGETVKPEKYYEARLMSTSNQNYAKREVESLLKSNLKGSYRKSGKYYMVVLGPFLSRQDADKELAAAKEVGKYKGTYIRKITSET